MEKSAPVYGRIRRQNGQISNPNNTDTGGVHWLQVLHAVPWRFAQHLYQGDVLTYKFHVIRYDNLHLTEKEAFAHRMDRKVIRATLILGGEFTDYTCHMRYSITTYISLKMIYATLILGGCTDLLISCDTVP